MSKPKEAPNNGTDADTADHKPKRTPPIAQSQSNQRKQPLRAQRIEQLRQILLELPELCFDFFIAIEPNTSIQTRINYAYDLRLFFNFIMDSFPEFSVPVRQFNAGHFSLVKPRHIELFLEYLNLYERDSLTRENENTGKKRKLCSIRSFYKYLYQHDIVESNPPSKVQLPKIANHPIVHLSPDEMAAMLDCAENGTSYSKHDQAYHKNTRDRDVALITLLLGTGIRIGECVGIDLADMDMDDMSFQVTRKGGDKSILYFDEQVKDALLPYYNRRKDLQPKPGHEKAFFLSLQMQRITARAVQLLVKKYASSAVPAKHITPHKFRSTFGTALYRNTGDIFLVADTLGHKDVNITKKHYASMDEERRRMAARAVKLRPEKDDELSNGGSPTPPSINDE